MKKNQFIFMLIAFLQVSLVAFSQTASVNNVKALYLRNIDAIVENDEVKGYLAFYLADKNDSKENTYKLIIWDNNLNKKYDINLVRPKNTYFLESSYNGDAFCYSFYNAGDKQLNYITYNKQGKKTGNYTVNDLSKMEITSIAQKSQAENNETYGGLVGIPNLGFVRYGLDNDKGRTVVVEMLDTVAKKVWSKSIIGEDNNDYVVAMPLISSKTMLVSTVYLRESMFSQNIKKSFIKFQDTKTGEDIFNFNTKGEKYQYSVYGVSFEGEDICMYGEYFGPDDNPFKDESTGLFIITLNKSGKVAKESYINWDDDIEKIMPGAMKNDKGKRVNLTMHKMVKTIDNNYFVICEQFYRNVDVGGIAMNALSRSNSSAMTKIVLQNMVVFQLNSDFKLVKSEVVSKDKSVVHLMSGMDFYGNSFVAMYLKSTGQFDYCFTNMSPDKKTFVSTYVNYDRESEKGNYIIGSISYTKDQKIVTDKVPLKGKPYSFMALPSKPGYVSVFEYYKKTKTMDIRLEKLNL